MTSSAPLKINGATEIAGVVGRPIAHSLSPRLHNAWIEALRLNAVYLPFSPTETGFQRLVQGFRGGVIRGLNVTLPFKAEALAIADRADTAAQEAGAANLLLFLPDGAIEARNTDGLGLLYAFAQQAPTWRPDQGPITIIGAGGAARGALAALKRAGATDIRILNRTRARAESLCRELGGTAFDLTEAGRALDGATTVINATSGQLQAELADKDTVPLPAHAPPGAVAMDMVYTPLNTPFLQAAAAAGFATVDGLDMLIGQARPSFEALFGQPPPELDARSLCLAREAGS